MSQYTETVITYSRIAGIRYRVEQEIVWEVGYKGGPKYIVPALYEFDVSVPFWLAWLFSRHEPKYFKAAAIHDKMLIEGWDRFNAGANFHQALKADGVSYWRRTVMWLAVSLYKSA